MQSCKAWCFYVMCWLRAQCFLPVDLDPSQGDHACPTTHQPPLIHLLTYKGVLRGTPGHCSVFLLYSMILGVIQIHKQCCRHFSVFQKIPTEYIKWIFQLEYLILKHWIRNYFQKQHMVGKRQRKQVTDWKVLQCGFQEWTQRILAIRDFSEIMLDICTSLVCNNTLFSIYCTGEHIMHLAQGFRGLQEEQHLLKIHLDHSEKAKQTVHSPAQQSQKKQRAQKHSAHSKQRNSERTMSRMQAINPKSISLRDQNS